MSGRNPSDGNQSKKVIGRKIVYENCSDAMSLS